MILPLLLALASPQVPERDWSATLREDAQALHDDIAANHPGPVNKADPGFARHNDAELTRALRRARTTRSYADYYFALREYVASFDDGHLSFSAKGNTPNVYSWPGFFTDYDGLGRIRVVVGSDAVPVGAELIGCDGRSAQAYAAATLAKAWRRWQLESQRRTFGRYLFLDEGSRYVPRARRCTFLVEGRKRVVVLDWQALSRSAFFEAMNKIGAPRARSFGARTLADGTRWFSILSFNGDPQSDAGEALPPMIAAMRADRTALGAAPAIVLDLRYNNGGSSDWSRQIAGILWGRVALNHLPRTGSTVDWRVSSANLAAIRESYDRRRAGTGLSEEGNAWFEQVIAGLSAGLARGDVLWRQRDAGAPDTPPAQDATPPFVGRVYVLTDTGCASACLDAVDLWRSLGAIHIGKTTSADTLYMDIRDRVLPSGLTRVSMPMKVYRDRPRGSNQPVVPIHPFDGDISDTAALEIWIASLPK